MNRLILVRATVKITRVEHHHAGTKDALTIVSLAGHDEEVIKLTWWLQGWVPFAKGVPYTITLERADPAREEEAAAVVD